MTMKDAHGLNRSLRIAAALFGIAATACACTHTGDEVATASIPDDYRQRHPIVVQESIRTVNVFVGNARGGLTASQRADVAALAQTWLGEGTGAIVLDVPINTPNARAATDSLREIRALLSAAGVPPRGVSIHSYQPENPRQFATIRLNYPRLAADAGPCGQWPEDLGPSIKNKRYLENKQYWNFGCSFQHNLAAMIDNPADLVQPRSETPAYTARRGIAFDKYRKGTATATTYPDADKAKLSEAGK